MKDLPRRAGSGRAGRPKLPPPREKQVEAACDRLMAGLGYTPVRFSQPRNTMQTPGIPDRRYYKPIGSAPGDGKTFPLMGTVFEAHAFWFECKRPGGKQSPAQLAFQQMVEACGEHYVAGGLDELVRYLVDYAPMSQLQREALRVQFLEAGEAHGGGKLARSP